LAALARPRPVYSTPICGDTIATVPHVPAEVRLCIEDPVPPRLTLEPQTNLFKLRLVNSDERRSSASYLIRRRYAWRGYVVGDHSQEALSRITVGAQDESGMVGTVTVGLDTPDGLFVDGLYADEVASLRDTGAKLAEFTRLAIDDNIHSKPLLAALFHIAFIYARRIHGCTHLLIEVNPRHEGFYRRMLGFERIGRLRGDPRIGAPAVLLRLDLAFAEAEIARLGGNPNLATITRSLYTHAFTLREEASIERRLRALG